MRGIYYFFAAVYQSIKSRRPDGTPYFNLCIGIVGVILLVISNCLATLKLFFHKDLISKSESTFMIWFLSLAVFFFIMVRVIMPIDYLTDVEVEQKDVKKMNLIFFSFGIINIIIMGCLASRLIPK